MLSPPPFPRASTLWLIQLKCHSPNRAFPEPLSPGAQLSRPPGTLHCLLPVTPLPWGCLPLSRPPRALVKYRQLDACPAQIFQPLPPRRHLTPSSESAPALEVHRATVDLQASACTGQVPHLPRQALPAPNASPPRSPGSPQPWTPTAPWSPSSGPASLTTAPHRPSTP